VGAWGTGAFENDTALDWLFELRHSIDLVLLKASLDTVVGGDQAYIDADLGSTGLAAAEVVAALGGQPATDLPQEVRDWVLLTAALWTRHWSQRPWQS